MSSLHPNYISKCQTKVHHRGWSVSALERTLPLPLPPTQASNCGPPSEALFASSANQPLITEHRWQELRVSTNTDASDTSEKNSLLSVWVPEVCSHSCGDNCCQDLQKHICSLGRFSSAKFLSKYWKMWFSWDHFHLWLNCAAIGSQ